MSRTHTQAHRHTDTHLQDVQLLETGVLLQPALPDVEDDGLHTHTHTHTHTQSDRRDQGATVGGVTFDVRMTGANSMVSYFVSLSPWPSASTNAT